MKESLKSVCNYDVLHSQRNSILKQSNKMKIKDHAEDEVGLVNLPTYKTTSLP